ncbi:helix-turn-helix transcriptional regulator [Aeromicrobium sp. Leaf350]|uniref:ArsR/SmtB family transcription factor n=1 Tax=Aeromicrobium sp. Leaf350 TaxID=2876565 RepID=UPI001E5DBF2F|nr:helix-turn-helix domain-containing protein [Aeromicrobium sp. Leaf350]
MRTQTVEGIDTLKALAHPIRITALGELRRNGPATASELARTLDESSGSMSYHLRQLERFGFVTDDVARDGRERRWRASAQLTELPAALTRTDEGRSALAVVRGVQQEHLARQLAALDAAGAAARPDLGHSDYLLRLDDADLAELVQRLSDVVHEYLDHEGEHAVALHVLALPGDR